MLSPYVTYAKTGSHTAPLSNRAPSPTGGSRAIPAIGDNTTGARFNVAAHIARAAASSAVEGGKCGAGALSSASPLRDRPPTMLASGHLIVQQVVIGGHGSPCLVGSFAPETAAFGYIYNFC